MLVLTRRAGEGFQITIGKQVFFIRYDRPERAKGKRGVLCSLSGDTTGITSDAELKDFGNFKKFWVAYEGEVKLDLHGETLTMSIQSPKGSRPLRGCRFGFVGPAFEVFREEIV